jgi:hypothetical protein
MGLLPTLPVFPPGGISLVQLAPWWRLWPRDPRRNILEQFGASVFPAVVGGWAPLPPKASLGQTVFAALLPLHQPATALAQWTDWVKDSIFAAAYPGPAPLLGILEHLLEPRPQAEQVEVWSQIVECAFKMNGEHRGRCDGQAIALLEAVGRSGLRALAPWVLSVLQCNDLVLVLAALACLARLGIPDTDVPAEVLLNRIRPELMEPARLALAFVETGDVDILVGLLRSDHWVERVQGLRVVEAVLSRGGPAQAPKAGWRESLVEALLAQVQLEKDCDVLRCLPVSLGLALRDGGEGQWSKVLEMACQQGREGHFESLVNALLIAELPAAAGARVEALRGQASRLAAGAVRAVDRLLMSFGEPSGSVCDWVVPEVVVFLQMGALRLPEAIRKWFTAPGDCPEAVVAARLIERPDSGLGLALCAAHLAARPDFVTVLERIWFGAGLEHRAPTLHDVGGLLAGAARDCAVPAAELRCCLGAEIGGPLQESPEMVGQLLGLMATQNDELSKSAEQLLSCTSPESRRLVGACRRWLKEDLQSFGDESQRWGWFSRPTKPPGQARLLPQELQPLFEFLTPTSRRPDQWLAALTLPDKRSKCWVNGCLDWKDSEAVRTAYEGTDAGALAATILQASVSPLGEARRLAVELAAGIGPRLVATPHGERLIQRVLFLAAQDPDADVRAVGLKAAAALGIADRVPALPPPPPPKVPEAPATPHDTEDADTVLSDADLNELIESLAEDALE